MSLTPPCPRKEVLECVKAHGTPLYVYDAGVITARYRALAHAFSYPDVRIFYAVKANSNREVLSLLASLGASAETVSPGEIALCRKAGFSPARISYTASFVTREELLSVLSLGVRVHLDSLSQLRIAGEAFPGMSVSLRINHGFGAGHHNHTITGGPESKFGIWKGDLPKAFALAKRYGLHIAGLHQHIGSGIPDVHLYADACDLLLRAAQHFPDIAWIDIGGGIGIPYKPGAVSVDIAELGKALSERMHAFAEMRGRKIEYALEPGRYLVAEAGVLLVTVTDIKRTPGHLFVGVNSGFNHLVRPMMYGSYHHILNIWRPRSKKVWCAVVGNVCESGDVFNARIALAEPKVGDTLAFLDTGAYGFSMSSEYNARPKPKEVLLYTIK